MILLVFTTHESNESDAVLTEGRILDIAYLIVLKNFLDFSEL
jgi:hypothetical protein